MRDIILEIQDLRHLQWSKIRNSSGSAGSFLKSYDDTGDRKIYYKLSDFDTLNGIVGHECVNEIVVQRLLSHLDIKHLEYRLIHALVKIDDKEYETYLCESYDFKKKSEKKLTLEEFYEMLRSQNDTPLQFCLRLGLDEYIYNMLTIDYLILNRDRHGANTEVLIDAKNRTVRPAPLFDHGLSLLCRCHTPEEVKAFDVLADRKVQSFVGGSSAVENLSLVPVSHLKAMPQVNYSMRDDILAGLDRILSDAHLDRIWEMIIGRWEYIDTIRNS